jgi:hypothetical protein
MAQNNEELRRKYHDAMENLELFMYFDHVFPQFSIVEVSDKNYFCAVNRGIIFHDSSLYVPVENGDRKSYVIVDRECLPIVLQKRWKLLIRTNIFQRREIFVVPVVAKTGPSLFNEIYGEEYAVNEYCFIESDNYSEVDGIIVADYRERHIWRISGRLTDNMNVGTPIPCAIHCNHSKSLLAEENETTVTYDFSAGITTENIGVVTINIFEKFLKCHSMIENDLEVVYRNKAYTIPETMDFLETAKTTAVFLADVLEGKIVPESLGFTLTHTSTDRMYKGLKYHSVLKPSQQEWLYKNDNRIEYQEKWYYNGYSYDDPVLVSAVKTVQTFCKRVHLSRRIVQRKATRKIKDNLVQSLQRLPVGICGRFPTFPGGEEYREILEECE